MKNILILYLRTKLWRITDFMVSATEFLVKHICFFSVSILPSQIQLKKSSPFVFTGL